MLNFIKFTCYIFIFHSVWWISHCYAMNTLSAFSANDTQWIPVFTMSADQDSETLEEPTSEQLKNLGIYSYIALGGEYVNYAEKESRYGANSEVTTNGLSFLSGGLLFYFAKKYAASLHVSSTLFPGSGDEEWRLNGETVQTNEFEFSMASTSLFGHYLFTPRSRIITGPAITLNNFTRSRFSGRAVDEITCEGDPDCITRELLRVEQERQFYISWLLGYGYYIEPKEKGDFRLNLSVFGGIPIYKDVQNTRFPDTNFSDTGGYQFAGIFSLGYMIYQGLDIGFYLDYTYIKFNSDTEVAFDLVNQSSMTVELPESITQVFHYGILLDYRF